LSQRFRIHLARNHGIPSVAANDGVPDVLTAERIQLGKGARLLVADLSAAAAPLIVTLGKEVWDTLLAIPSLHARPPRETFTDLYGDAYGATGSLTVNGRDVVWLPLIHPGLLKGEPDRAADIPAGTRTVKGWATIHARWAVAAVQDGARTYFEA
jgi:hypothetical protein